MAKKVKDEKPIGDLISEVLTVKKPTKKKDKDPELSKNEMEDTLTRDLINGVNSALKGNNFTAAYYLSDPNITADVKYWVSTGCSVMDLAISNRPNGGFPVGRISEVTGWQQSGKSLMAAHALASTQKMGGIAVFIDTESAISKEYLVAIGVDVDKLMYIQLETMEDIFTAIETIVEKVRLKQKNRIVTIVVDSVMGASTKIEMEADYDKDGYATSKSIIISKGMRKLTNLIARQSICLIFTNQLREKLGVSFGDSATTSGGKALAFHASVRLRLKSLGQIKAKVNGVEIVVGGKTEVIVQKNRMGPPLRKVNYEIYFDSGIDDYGSWITIMKTYNIVRSEGFSVIFDFVKDKETGEVEEIKFLPKNMKKVLDSNPELKKQMYDQICDSYIMKYRMNEDYTEADLTFEAEFLDENA